MRTLSLLGLLGLMIGCGPTDSDGDGVPVERDCDDSNPLVYNGAPELCDELDNNCNGEVDEQPADSPIWYFDSDGDGFGDDRRWLAECQPIAAGYVLDPGDCDDADAEAFPGGSETCDGVDNDCDGAVDEGNPDAAAWYADVDEDGYGDPEAEFFACFEPDGYVKNADDCDDADPNQYPEAPEYCNGEDDNCNDVTDEPGVLDGTSTYEDKDGDGLGDAATESVVCEPPTGAVLNGDDCDDGDRDVRNGCTCSDYSEGDLVVASGETVSLAAGAHHFKRVEIEEGGILTFKPGEAAAIYAFQVDVKGLIDLRGQDGTRSASGSPPNGGAAGPGGGGGGGGGTCGNGAGSGGAPNGGAPPGGARSGGGNGGPPVGLDVAAAAGGGLSGSTGFGGGGGGHDGDGRDGGGAFSTFGLGGSGFGSEQMTFEFGGGGGGAGGGANGGGGGGGGGALKIFASYITINDNGEIKADGGAGAGKGNGGCIAGGGGGGGGGAVWIHGDQVEIDGGTIQALGGRGSSSGVSYGGGTGADGRIRVSGIDVELKANRLSPSPYTDLSSPPCPLPEPEEPEEPE